MLPSLGSTIANRYVLESALGSGAMGSVFRARRTDGLPVAIKVLHGEALTRWDLRRRFEREASALASVVHPNVIGVLEFGEADGALFLAMELLAGDTLETLLARERLAPEVAVTIADQMLAGLAFAHAHGILHRDMKPDNVFLAKSPDGTTTVKLLDFGLAKFADGETWGPRTVLTVQGAIMGTPAYMAPEQVFGPSVDARTDVYGAGVVLFEMLTGSWPFVAEELTDLFRAHAIEPPPTLRAMRPELEARPELDAVVQRALAKAPADRFADAREMRLALAKVPRPVARLVPA
jgi:eukaryotic-like serine/threonine-protein kinase